MPGFDQLFALTTPSFLFLSPQVSSPAGMFVYPTVIVSRAHLFTMNMNAPGFSVLKFAPASLTSRSVNNGSAINPNAGSGVQQLFSAAAGTSVPSPSATGNGLAATGASSTPDQIRAPCAPSPSLRSPAPATVAQVSDSDTRPLELSGSPLTGTISPEPAPGGNFSTQSLQTGDAENAPHGPDASSVVASGATRRGLSISSARRHSSAGKARKKKYALRFHCISTTRFGSRKDWDTSCDLRLFAH